MRHYFVVMMMAAAAAAVGLASVEGSLVHDRNVGDFRQVDPDDDNKGDFFTATSDKAYYSSSNDPFVCVTSFDKVLQQVVSGINYQFHVHGCAVDAPSKAKADCTCGDRPIQKFVIEVYAQAWTQTYKVTKVSTVPQRHEL